MNEINEKCAVFGIYGQGLDVSRLTFYGLYALQHRGQESSGIATGNGTEITCHKDSGLVNQVYSEKRIQSLKGHVAIGHNRYSTSRGTGLRHAQPVYLPEYGLAIAHNGNLPSVRALVDFLTSRGIAIAGDSDSELMAKAIGCYLKDGLPLRDAIVTAYPLFTGAFSLVVMTKDTLAAIRDRCGIRPLAIGKLSAGGGSPPSPGFGRAGASGGNGTEGYVFASETCAFHTIGAELVREVQPGEIVTVSQAGVESVQAAPATPRLDMFEFVYFARPDSTLLGRSVYQVRQNFGVRLAREYPVSADVVVPVPETATPVAIGYANASGIPLEMALVKNRYIHRTFIQPAQHSRDLGVKLKLTPLPEILHGKRVVLVDDSIVRGTTSRQIVKMLFDAGAKEVHFLLSSPPIKFPDFYGIDTPRQTELIAAGKSVEEIRQFLGATSLYYLSLQGMIDATGLPDDVFNLSCFTGEYPIDLQERYREFGQPVVPPEKPLARLF